MSYTPSHVYTWMHSLATLQGGLQATTSVSIGFMESLKGTHKTLSMDLGDGSGSRNVNVDVPAGVEHGQQLLLQDVIRTSTSRVSLVVQVCRPEQSFSPQPCSQGETQVVANSCHFPVNNSTP